MMQKTLPRSLDQITLCAEILSSCRAPRSPAMLEPIRRKHKDVAACAASPTQFKKWLRYLKQQKLLAVAGPDQLVLTWAGSVRLRGLQAGWSASTTDLVVHHGTVLARGEEREELSYR